MNLVAIEKSKQINKLGQPVEHLIIDNEIWMSNDDPEIDDAERAIKYAKGVCFVAGLGLGLIVKMLADKQEVTKVVVCEINPGVISINEPRFGLKKVDDHWESGKILVYLADANKDLQKFACFSFDFVYNDIYEEPTESNWRVVQRFFENIKPLCNKECIYECWCKDRFKKGIFWS